MSYRSRNANNTRWLWLSAGALMGFGCAAVACVIALAGGFISLNQPTATLVAGDLEATNPTVCGPLDEICGTPGMAAPSAATDESPPPAPATETSQPDQPADTAPPGDDTSQDDAPTPTKPPPLTATPTITPPATATPEPTSAPIDARLVNIVTELMPVSGGENIEMGTTINEATTAVNECVNAGGNCDISYAEDSFPVHNVKLSSFQMERYEVTVRQFLAFLNTLGPNGHATGCGGARCAATQAEDGTSPAQFDETTYSAVEFLLDRPMTNVTWYGADAYCKAIGRRLPTEAEWERAARGTNPGEYIYPWGRSFDSARANTNREIDGTAPFDAYPTGASPYGVENMAGNAGEWVYDWYQSDFYGLPAAQELDTTGPFAGSERVIRGGAWDQRPFFSRTVHRLSREPGEALPWLGFRCVSDESPPPTAIPAAGAPDGGEANVEPSETPTLDPNVTPTALPTVPPGG